MKTTKIKIKKLSDLAIIPERGSEYSAGVDLHAAISEPIYISALHNDSNMSRLINPGERIAQLVVLPYVSIEFKEVDKLSDTDRGFGGFGSTGK